MPKASQEARKLERIRDQVRVFYGDLKHRKLTLTKAGCPIIAKRFGDILEQRTGYKDLDQLLVRLHRRKDESLMVLERPIFPFAPTLPRTTCGLCHQAPHLGRTMSADGRQARSVMLGLMKTCASSASPSSLIRVFALASTGQTRVPPFLPHLVVGQPA